MNTQPAQFDAEMDFAVMAARFLLTRVTQVMALTGRAMEDRYALGREGGDLLCALGLLQRGASSADWHLAGPPEALAEALRQSPQFGPEAFSDLQDHFFRLLTRDLVDPAVLMTSFSWPVRVPYMLAPLAGLGLIVDVPDAPGKYRWTPQGRLHLIDAGHHLDELAARAQSIDDLIVRLDETMPAATRAALTRVRREGGPWALVKAMPLFYDHGAWRLTPRGADEPLEGGFPDLRVLAELCRRV